MSSVRVNLSDILEAIQARDEFKVGSIWSGKGRTRVRSTDNLGQWDLAELRRRILEDGLIENVGDVRMLFSDKLDGLVKEYEKDAPVSIKE